MSQMSAAGVRSRRINSFRFAVGCVNVRIHRRAATPQVAHLRQFSRCERAQRSFWHFCCGLFAAIRRNSHQSPLWPVCVDRHKGRSTDIRCEPHRSLLCGTKRPVASAGVSDVAFPHNCRTFLLRCSLRHQSGHSMLLITKKFKPRFSRIMFEVIRCRFCARSLRLHQFWVCGPRSVFVVRTECSSEFYKATFRDLCDFFSSLFAERDLTDNNGFV